MHHTRNRVSFLLALFICTLARAAVPTSQPYPGLRYWHESRKEPAMSLFVVQVDLKNPDLSVRVSPAGKDPDGGGEWQTILMPPSKIAQREQFDACINASFFSAKSTKDAEGEKSGYVAGKWASAVGFGMSDGKFFSSELQKGRPTFWVDSHNAAHLATIDKLDPDSRQAVQGNAFVLKAGATVDPEGMMKVRHPRTVVGLDKDGNTLTILTVDGRRAGVSIGMTGPELGQEMKRLGCDIAMNLDGGGSTELVLRDPDTGKLKVMNQPSDGRERAVADVIGIQVKGAKRADTKNGE